MKLQNNYALVTGASLGIGKYISIELAVRGYNIVAVSNQPQQLAELKNDLEQKYAIHVFTINIDLANQKAAEEIFNFCNSKNITVEVMVNNAGILITGDTLDVESSRANAILHLHIITPVLLCQLFGRQMKLQKKGYILNVSSISAVMPFPIISLYGPSKSFLRNFTRALRTEVKGYGINTTCLLPGATETALYDSHNFNIPLALKLGIMKKPGKVATAGVNALFSGKAECIPGMVNKLIVFIIPLIPNIFVSWIYNSRKRKQQLPNN